MDASVVTSRGDADAAAPRGGRARFGTALATTGLLVAVASAMVVPPLLAHSTADQLDRLSESDEVEESAAPSEITLPEGVGSSAGLRALAAAYTQAGKPYSWGGTGPDAWDCSGLVQWAFGQAGVDLPRVSEDQALAGEPIPVEAMAPGDVITFRDAADHVGIYAGFGQVFNAYDEDVPIGLTGLADLPPIHNVQRF
ncbi:C40 family peptidase [Rhodococcus maanshanensis]|uniref:Cell wall-associated hydrolase, NlpC family n=1 Tax=Rhodococcus maanshanensis TaxID=183556 RepID=A0A1H7XSD3_9NOCA|nr:NlpC/P60 family protein [Rhodococcus maanshanensis]SEM36776.1 Cell wall-associated hydrolase, NlpC family [Rhodococcus maanshanensis]